MSNRTYIVSLEEGRSIKVEAAYCGISTDTLLFTDEDSQTVRAFAPGHWIEVARVEGHA